MIFFMTVIIPPPKTSKILKDLQNKLFAEKQIFPSPFPFILNSLSERKPERPSRSKIAEMYPEVIETKEYSIVDNNLYLSIVPSLSSTGGKLDCGILLGSILDNHKPLEEYEQFDYIQFKNYSLGLFEISSREKKNFWMNMSWTKLWEVPRTKS